MARKPDLESLPILDETWEIARLPNPEAGGWMLLVGVAGAPPRFFGPQAQGQPLDRALEDVFRKPMSGKPGRPKLLRVSDPALLQEMQPTLARCKRMAQVVDELPAVAEALAFLLADFGAPQAPGLDVELPAWREALRVVAEAQPWSRFGEDVRVTFGKGPLKGRVAIVIGGAGENRGVCLYASEQDHARHASGDGLGANVFTLLLEPSGELTSEERKACAKAGLVHRGLHAKAIVIVDGEIRTPEAPEQRTLLAGVQVVAELCAGRMADILAGEHVALVVPTMLGAQEIRVEYGEDEMEEEDEAPPLFFADVRILGGIWAANGGTPRKSIFFKMLKADAVQAVPLLRSIVAMEVEGAPGGRIAHVRLDTGALRFVLEEDGHVESWFFDKLTEPQVGLMLCSGGPKRTSLTAEDILAQVVVPVVRR